MGLADDLALPETPRQAPTMIDRLLDELPDEHAGPLRATLLGHEKSHKFIADAIKRNGYLTDRNVAQAVQTWRQRHREPR